MRYALINGNVIANVIELQPRNAASFPGMVGLGDIPTGIGDLYQDGVFFREGVRLITQGEQLAELQTALDTVIVSTLEG